MIVFTNSPTPVSFNASATIVDKLRMFLGHYDLRVYLTDKGYIDVGRGSFDAARYVEFAIDDYDGCMGTVGQFCNFASPCTLFGGGEHWHENPVNLIFNNVPPFAAASRHLEDLRPKPQTPFHIGHAVVISGHAKVMGGATIGDGAVVAASALAIGKVAPFTIVGGVPAKPIRERFGEATKATKAAMEQVRWWDFDLTYMGNDLARIQQLAVDTNAQHVYRKPSPVLVVRMTKEAGNLSVQIPGFLAGGETRPLRDAPVAVQKYLSHIGGPGPYYWLADMWSADA